MYLRYRIHSLSNIFTAEQDIKPLFIYFYTLCYSVINIADIWFYNDLTIIYAYYIYVCKLTD